MVLNLDLNFPPVESPLAEETSGYRHPWVLQETSFSGEPQSSRASGRQQGSSALIDLELIEEEVVILSSSRGFPKGRNHSRRNQPVTVVLDEDQETNLRRSVVVVEEQVARSSLNTHNKRGRSSTSSTVITSDLYLDLEEGYNAKRKNVMKSEPEPEKVTTKEPTFTCPVCMNELVEASSTICGHIFCLRCIKASIQKQKKCPICGKKLTKNNYHRVYLPAAE